MSGLSSGPVLERRADREGAGQAVRLLVRRGTRGRQRFGVAAVAVVWARGSRFAVVLERHERTSRRTVDAREPSLGHRRDDTRRRGERRLGSASPGPSERVRPALRRLVSWVWQSPGRYPFRVAADDMRQRGRDRSGPPRRRSSSGRQWSIASRRSQDEGDQEEDGDATVHRARVLSEERARDDMARMGVLMAAATCRFPMVPPEPTHV
jgi:hypothetical protein